MSNNNYPKISDLSSPILDAIPDMFVPVSYTHLTLPTIYSV